MIRSFSTPGCERARAQISALVDGELSELEEAELSLHLDACGDCHAYHSNSVSLSRLLRGAPPEHPEDPIVVPRRRYVANRWVQAGSAAAAVLMAIGLGSSQGLLSGSGALSSATGALPTSASSRTYVQSADYERRLLDSLRNAPRAHTGSGVPV
jgi:anti-sigma factor RsiW